MWFSMVPHTRETCFCLVYVGNVCGIKKLVYPSVKFLLEMFSCWRDVVYESLERNIK